MADEKSDRVTTRRTHGQHACDDGCVSQADDRSHHTDAEFKTQLATERAIGRTQAAALRSEYRVKVIYKITYPTGKILHRKR